jgi:UDP-N-acetylmuramyl tripeptide synthase
MIRYDSTGDRGGSGVGVVINGYVHLKLKRRFFYSHPISSILCATAYFFPSKTAQSGEESILVASLRGVIANQAAEIEALRSKVKELITTTTTSSGSTTAAATASEDSSQSAVAAKLAEVSPLLLFLSFLSWLADGG